MNSVGKTNTQAYNLNSTSSVELSLTTRCYTSHEHLDKVNLINMNGRLYDPLTARMLSPDPFVQNASSTQNYNRYSYCMNNPLKYTDPSGYYYMPDGTWIDPWIDDDKYSADKFAWEVEHMNPDGSYKVPKSQWQNICKAVNTINAFNKAISELEQWQKLGYNLYQITLFNKTEFLLSKEEPQITGNDKDGYRALNEVYSISSFMSDYFNEIGLDNLDEVAEGINKVSDVLSLSTDIAAATLTSTKIGSNIAYKIAYSKILIKAVNSLKPLGYIFNTLSIASDFALYKTGNQSLGETSLNISVSATSMIIGGWVGIVIQLNYMASKEYLQGIKEHPEYAPYPYHGFNH